MNDAHRKARLRYLIEADFKGSRAAFMQATGISKSRLAQVAGPTEPFGEEAAERLAHTLSLPATWFSRTLPTIKEAIQMGIAVEDGYPGDPIDSAESILVKSATPAPEPGGGPAIHVALLANRGSMGPGNDALHEDVMVGAISLSPEWVSKRIRPTSVNALRFIHAYGDSMSSTFEDGDILLVDTGAINPSSADGIYVLMANHRVFIKRVTERMGGGFDVTNDNPKIKTVDDLDGRKQITVLGRVVWVWNGKKM